MARLARDNDAAESRILAAVAEGARPVDARAAHGYHALLSAPVAHPPARRREHQGHRVGVPPRLRVHEGGLRGRRTAGAPVRSTGTGLRRAGAVAPRRAPTSPLCRFPSWSRGPLRSSERGTPTGSTSSGIPWAVRRAEPLAVLPDDVGRQRRRTRRDLAQRTPPDVLERNRRCGRESRSSFSPGNAIARRGSASTPRRPAWQRPRGRVT